MNYLTVDKVSKSVGEKELFHQITFGLEKGQKSALIARNGTGKSTLLNIIADDDLSLVGGVESGNDTVLRAFPRAVAGDEGAFLPLLQTERDLVEEFFLAHGLGDLIDG